MHTFRLTAFGTAALLVPALLSLAEDKSESGLPRPACEEHAHSDTGAYELVLNTCETPDLTDWAHQQLLPMAREWYPKLIQLLPSAGFEPPNTVTISFSKDMRGVAGTSGANIRCGAAWFRENLKGEAVGAVFHELVHVVQHYGHSGHERPDAVRPPGWLVEGMADYLRWFKFEPESHGADLIWMRARRNLSLRYDASYRISANFLNWVSEKYDPQLATHLNAAIREGKYGDNTWKTSTGHTAQELGEEWKKNLEGMLAIPPEAAH